MANSYSFNNTWFGYSTVRNIDWTWGRANSSGSDFISPFVREKWSGDSTWYVHFFENGAQVDDALYFAGRGGEITGVEFRSSSYFSPIVSTSHTIQWEYWNGTAWTALPSLTDGTNNLTQPGKVTWDIPSDWAGYDYIDGSSHHYPALWVRARLTTANNITDGGKTYYSHFYIRPYTIYVTGSDDLYIKDVYDADQSNGWGTTEMPDDHTIIFKNGFIDGTSNNRLIVNNWLNQEMYWAPTFQFGTREHPTYWGSVLYGNKEIHINDISLVSSHYQITNQNMDIILYTAWQTRGYGNADYVYLAGQSGSIAQNVDFSIRSNFNEGAGLYDPYFAKYRFITNNYFDFNLCNFKSDRGSGTLVTEGYTTYYRCNLSDIQYILTNNWKAEYNNCYVGRSFNIDPIREVIFKNSSFGYGNDTDDWYHMYTPKDGRAHYHEFVDCEWLSNNKYVLSHSFNNYSSDDLNLKTYFVNTVKIKVVDSDGNPIQGAEVYLLDKDNNRCLYQNDENNYVYYTYTYTDTSISLKNADNISVGDYLLIFGEALKVTNITNKGSYYQIDVDREQLNTKASRVQMTGGSSPAVNSIFEKLETDSNGEIHGKIVETMHDRSGDINTIRQIDKNPFLLTIKKKGYQTYQWSGEIKEKMNWTIVLQKQVPVIITSEGTSINLDPSNPTNMIYN